jgi:hypothetical protein
MLSAKCDDRFASDFYAFAYALRRSFTTTSGLLLTASSFERGNRDVAFVVSVVLFFFFFCKETKHASVLFCASPGAGGNSLLSYRLPIVATGPQALLLKTISLTKTITPY